MVMQWKMEGQNFQIVQAVLVWSDACVAIPQDSNYSAVIQEIVCGPALRFFHLDVNWENFLLP